MNHESSVDPYPLVGPVYPATELFEEFIVDDRERFVLPFEVDRIYNFVMVYRQYDSGGIAESLYNGNDPNLISSWRFDLATNSVVPGQHIWRNVGTRIRVSYVPKFQLVAIPFEPIAEPSVEPSVERAIKLRRTA